MPPFSLRKALAMRVVLWCCRIFIFLFLLAFALKNTAPVSVSFFFDTSWQAPLIIVVLAFFAAGMALGVLALLGTIFGLRREIARLKAEYARLTGELATTKAVLDVLGKTHALLGLLSESADTRMPPK